jgi:hypothetical protein
MRTLIQQSSGHSGPAERNGINHCCAFRAGIASEFAAPDTFVVQIATLWRRLISSPHCAEKYPALIGGRSQDGLPGFSFQRSRFANRMQ